MTALGDRRRSHAPVPAWFSRTTATASPAGVSSPRLAKAMNQVVLEPGTPVPPVPVFPPTDQPDLRGRARPPLDREAHHPRDRCCRVRSHGTPDEDRALPQDDPSAGRDDPLHDRLHEPPADADRARDHRHLQRRDEHALPTEGHPARVDVGVERRVVEPPVLAEAARRPSSAGVSSGGRS